MKKKIITGLLLVGFYSSVFSSHIKQFYGQFNLGYYSKNYSYSPGAPHLLNTLGYRFNNNLDLQISINYMNDKQKTILSEGNWHFIGNTTKLAPYVSIGVYKNRTVVLSGFSFGFGLKNNVLPNAYLFTNYRYFQSWGYKNAEAKMISMGIGIYFGSPKKESDYDNISLTSSHQELELKAIYYSPFTEKNIKECKDNAFEIACKPTSCYKVDKDNIKIYLDIKFPYNSYKLDDKSKLMINRFINFMNEHDIDKILLKGFSSQGKTNARFSEYNYKLSTKRANSVKEYMIFKGLYPANIEAFGYSDDNPLAPNITKNNQLVNQRVEAKLSLFN